MSQAISRNAARRKRQARIRLTVAGTPARPRLAVFRSLNQIYAQLIDDTRGHTLAAASSLEDGIRDGGTDPTAQARAVGRLLAERARTSGVEKAVFDRAGYRYHGRVRSLADGAREAGLEL
jgi:large subunit ribosomal protein L18